MAETPHLTDIVDIVRNTQLAQRELVSALAEEDGIVALERRQTIADAVGLLADITGRRTNTPFDKLPSDEFLNSELLPLRYVPIIEGDIDNAANVRFVYVTGRRQLAGPRETLAFPHTLPGSTMLAAFNIRAATGRMPTARTFQDMYGYEEHRSQTRLSVARNDLMLRLRYATGLPFAKSAPLTAWRQLADLDNVVLLPGDVLDALDGNHD